MEIEASQITQGGGRVLLFDLLDYLYKTNQSSILWIESREIFTEVRSLYGSFFDLRLTSLMQTIKRYLEHRKNVIFFCSIPPLRKCENSVVYFQNRYYAWNFKQIIGLIRQRRFRGFVQVTFFKIWNNLFKKNVDVWACQSSDVCQLLNKNLKIKARVLPFYNIEKPLISERKFDFCYVAFPYPHKNHKLLLDSVRRVAKYKNISLVLTIPDSEANKDIINYIDKINNQEKGVQIFNFGSVPRSMAMSLYSESKYLIFPSELETLGLPLIEAYYCGLKIIAADMPYAHAAIENLICFDPKDGNEFDKVLKNALNGNYDSIVQTCLIPNKIEELVSIVQ